MSRPRWPMWCLFRRLNRVLSAHFCWALMGTALAADGITLSAPRASDVEEGEILLGELNCLACHPAPDAIRTRVNSRRAPVLGAAGLQLTPQWLGGWLADPAKSKPGTLMPHTLHGLSANERSEAVDTLTHFLVSLQPASRPMAVSADPVRADKGRIFYHSAGCVACHTPFDRGNASEETFRQAQATAIPLGELARKYPAGELVRFLRDPVSHRPGGRMPALELSESEAIDLATYLLREQLAAATNAPAAPVPGLTWEYFEGDFDRCAQLEKATAVASGVTDGLTDKLARRGENFGLRFSGLLEVPFDGEYEFWTTSDDGSQLWIDAKVVVDNDRDHGAVTRSGKVTLTKGSHPFQVLFFQGGGGFEFALNWSGPGFARGPIPASALKHQARPLVPLGQKPFVVNPAKVAIGRGWFAKLNCAACHSGVDVPASSASSVKPLLDLATSVNAGCLADVVPATAPQFDLSAVQRRALRKTVAAANGLAAPLSPSRQVSVTMTRLNCYACHSRNEVGGPVASGRADWFKVVGEVDLGDEGRIPPGLSGVGAKLKPAWLGEVLQAGTKVRPYMATRMPQFGATNVATLQPELLAADRRADRAQEPPLTERDAKFGWKLVGRDGLTCIACHTFSTLGSTGIPALGLDTMYRRLEWDWFRRYLPDPAALRPGTRMPTFWPDGQAVNRAILGGDSAAQIKAIWAYLAGGTNAEVPAGLIRGRKELVADREPVIYRNFIEGAGTRAIGVGYPERANLAFDAEQLRLALIWQGGFIDASRHSTDRGVGFEPPLGDHRIGLPPGPALAVLPTATAAWPAKVQQQFKGYHFNAARQPIFQYVVEGAEVSDSITPRPGEVDMTFVRKLKLVGPSVPSLWFRAASGKIQRAPDGSFTVDDKLRFQFRGGGEPQIVGQELRVPVTVPGELVVEMTW